MFNKAIGGTEFTIKNYTINNKLFYIGAPVFNEKEGHVIIRSRRNIDYNPFGIINPVAQKSIDNSKIFNAYFNPYVEWVTGKHDFFKDIDFLVDVFKRVDFLDNEIILKAFVEICIDHIKEIGRMVDDDLYIYIDETLIVSESLYLNLLNIELKTELQRQAFPEFVEHSIRIFREYIYVTHYNVSSMDPYLVKYTDM